ncbi:MAG TPA: pilus assembly protein PilP [Desulfobacteraceae bacterium]|nr:pilus assembly protein PilP [Desulfobacteraceae bacterium]HPJ67432.1 pilus assembly protein PilP [Desulfobacteraceae bacterium]HPQ29196.1 pilus assembly protein PilP [Desulfobacteraceae bacterium]
MIQAILIIVFVLVGSGSSYAAPDIVFKDSRPEKDLTEKKEEAAYVYNPAGKTDPFAPFITKQEKSLKDFKSERGAEKGTRLSPEIRDLLNELKRPQTELQRIEISELTLTSIIKGKDKVWAMVSDSKGRGYMLEKGSFIGTQGGVVERIICEEKDTDFGMESIRKIIIKEPFINSDKNLEYKSIEMKMPFATLQ